MPNRPESYELTAIALLQAYFRQPITILQPTGAYKRKTADVLIGATVWEIKTVFSKHLSKLKDRFKIASQQSDHIIIDLRYAQFEEAAALRYITTLSASRRRVKCILCITKDESIVVIK